MAESDTILQLGIDAAREGNREEARNLFGLLTRQEPDNLQAWLWLAGVADSPEERRAALERVLELDPSNDMAVKGLQSMGVTPAASPAPDFSAGATIPAAAAADYAAREMTDEERYAAELDSAFDDYDALPRVEAPPRVEPDLDDLEAGAARVEAERRAERRASRRGTTTPVRSYDDDDDLRPYAVQRDGGGLRRVLLAVIGIVGLLLVLFLAFQFINRRNSTSVATNPTAVTAPGEPTAALPGVSTDGTNTAGGTTSTGGVTSTGSMTSTGGVNSTGAVTSTGGVNSTGAVTSTGGITSTGNVTTTGGTAGGTPPQADLAAANPQPVGIGTQLSANGWSYTFPDSTYAAALGSQIGGSTANGTYAIVLVYVANNSGTDQALPADFFVLKDAQGRIYRPLPQVSSAYVQRGVNADISQEDPVPANGVTTSIPLIFDVEHGATNLVLFASGKTDQGWPVIESVP
ncbi:MAG TPA: tetratricopeptide repeat protein [Roseiflexaceae bacterium]|nr:tetratricopeptide repeat protein [Roseiflexaceae bacterium]